MARDTDGNETSTQTTLDATQFRADGGVAVETPTDGYGLSDIPLDDMALGGFPDPRKVTTLVGEDEAISGTTKTPDAEDIDPENNVMLVMDGREVAQYLEKQQKKSDHWLNNELKTLLQRGLTGQHGMARGVRLSDYDKRWLVKRERKRRADAGEWNPTPGEQAWQELPNERKD